MLEITYLETCNICHEHFTNDQIVPCKRCTLAADYIVKL